MREQASFPPSPMRQRRTLGLAASCVASALGTCAFCLIGGSVLAESGDGSADYATAASRELRQVSVSIARLPEPLMDLNTRGAVVPEENRDSPGAAIERAYEEVIVQGEPSLAAYRVAINAARDQVMNMFNEINSNDEFDIHCRNEIRTGSHIPSRTCRPRFQREAATDAAREWLAALRSKCLTVNSACIFGDAADEAMSRAQAIESESRYLDDRLTEEIWRLASEDAEFAQALMDYEALRQAYKKAREELRD